jgi:SAM-dependent methyltransferase
VSYKDLAHYYDIIYDMPETTRKEMEFFQWAFSNLSDIPVKTILDAAAGTGRHAIPLAQSGYEVTAADASLEMLDVLREKLRNLHVPILHWDVRELEFENRFDAVLMIFTSFNHLLKDEDAERALKVIYRALTPGGIFIFDVANFFNLLGRFKESSISTHERGDVRIIRFVRQVVEDVEAVLIHDETSLVEEKGTTQSFHTAVPLRMYTKHEVERLLRNTGFSQMHCFRDWDDRREQGKQTFRLVFVAKKSKEE